MHSNSAYIQTTGHMYGWKVNESVSAWMNESVDWRLRKSVSQWVSEIVGEWVNERANE